MPYVDEPDHKDTNAREQDRGRKDAVQHVRRNMREDGLLGDADIESALSVAYVHAIAAEAGFTCGEPPGPDRDSVDLQIAAAGVMRPKLNIQLKASVRLQEREAQFRYPLKLKNYNDLRVDTQTPRLLVVLNLPRDRKHWLSVSAAKLIIKRAAYWVSLRGSPELDNLTSVTVSIPKANVFDVSALTGLMQLSREGKIA